MKKLLLAAGLLLCVVAASAQTNTNVLAITWSSLQTYLAGINFGFLYSASRNAAAYLQLHRQRHSCDGLGRHRADISRDL